MLKLKYLFENFELAKFALTVGLLHCGRCSGCTGLDGVIKKQVNLKNLISGEHKVIAN